jgi:RND family efflux transporter MFP subunit
MKWKLSIFLCVIISAIAAGLILVIFSTEPTAKRITAKRETPMLVEVIKAEAGTFSPTIVAMGTVIPEKEIELSPRIGGQITQLADAFSPGGYVTEGDWLVKIDPADYEATVLERESALHQAQADLQMELGRQDVARQDFELMDQTIVAANKSLVLREPQLNAAKAKVEATEAALKRAQLDLQRTRIVAPFDAHILSREANLGSLVSPGSELAKLVGIDTYWVEATVPLSTVNWIVFPQPGQPSGSPAAVRNRSAWESGQIRAAKVHSLVGSLDTRTRLARILVSVEDPLALKQEQEGQPQLIVGSYVEVQITGKPLENAVRLPREYLRKDDTAWVMKDNALQVRELDIVFTDDKFVYVSQGLLEGESIVVTNLSTVREGSPLRLKEVEQ